MGRGGGTGPHLKCQLPLKRSLELDGDLLASCRENTLAPTSRGGTGEGGGSSGARSQPSLGVQVTIAPCAAANASQVSVFRASWITVITLHKLVNIYGCGLR